VVPADSQHIPRARCYSGIMTTTRVMFSRTGLSPTTAAHPRNVPLTPHNRPSEIRQNPYVTTPQPRIRNPCRVSHEHGLATIRFRSPLLTESQLFSLPVGTEMFHFPTFPPHTYFIQHAVTPHNGCWVTPFGHPRITARLTTPRGLSRPPTSFIGS
jgi:hypothetical protein